AAIVTAAAAIALKHLIIYKGRNVFNPASLGLVLCGFVFGFGGGWWSSSNPALIIILGILVMYRVKGYYMVVPYLVLFFLLFTISKSFAVTADSFLNPIILFFSFFMLTEHKTAPHFAMQRVIYGSVIAVFAFVLFYYLPAYFLLLPLLIGNICGLVIEQLIKK
ncbi:MAG: RnfABCDGE type electron transport complex subunit D, partial [Candidatus Micrarchaeota archaeon]|nr:RnfABCDGE type electron transport complex subunit D [Candidatus Micrarchaeota archaeon]